LTVAIGVMELLFGVYIAVSRRLQPQKMAKLEALKVLFGDKIGNLIHVSAYTVIPLVAGGIFVFAGLRGVALF
ncbi:MAG TPA: hypothetical protein VM571_10840, partial [Noviherbaspirillum sp.]|nr:hypothetical protein [Noviherbaspirillum sp.]